MLPASSIDLCEFGWSDCTGTYFPIKGEGYRSHKSVNFGPRDNKILDGFVWTGFG